MANVFTPRQIKKIQEIAAENHLKLVLLFGSQASEKTHKESDIDIGILPSKNLTFEEEIKITTEFSNIALNFDLSNLQKASPLLLKKVIENCEIIYQRNPEVFSIFEIYALNRYQEAYPLFEIKQQLLYEFIKK